ncbi:uncharacterized protein LOC126562991 [Anopheles maculipalpis]|uniref:uncharacterized protein LOC126562991 n=1 Tax=Anopheles maculipalpis TaxID=1496333 RepID=UPI002158AC78|nr:uncharacterized protein LOC126562991 [Anopheles maculipalpis]
MELFASGVACVLILTVWEVVGEPEGRSNSTSKSEVEARYDHYEDIFRYWWPWFSDLWTVVAIKLKIWILLVAMHVFGDGYYWTKWNGSSVFDKSSQYVQQPPGFGWGRRRKRRDVRMNATSGNNDMAELIFDKLDINDDTCRRRIVCELYLEGKRVPEIWRVLQDSGCEVFRAYRPKISVKSSSECSKHYNCQLHKIRDDVGRLGSINGPAESDDWRWPR